MTLLNGPGKEKGYPIFIVYDMFLIELNLNMD